MRKIVTRFVHVPQEPGGAEAANAYVIARSTHEAASSFLVAFEHARLGRKAVGTPTDAEQDLLRAMLVFASAGLDSMVKQLIADALPRVIARNEGARAMFRGFVEGRLARQDRVDPKFLATVLTSDQPRQVLLDDLVAYLSAGSLQSKDALFKAASFFDVPSAALTKQPDVLKRIFDVRNQIAHEMDIDFSQPNRNRFPRKKKYMQDSAAELLRIAAAFLAEVDRRLG